MTWWDGLATNKCHCVFFCDWSIAYATWNNSKRPRVWIISVLPKPQNVSSISGVSSQQIVCLFVRSFLSFFSLKENTSSAIKQRQHFWKDCSKLRWNLPQCMWLVAKPNKQRSFTSGISKRVAIQLYIYIFS